MKKENDYGIREDKSQIFRYNNPEFPAYVNCTEVRENVNFAVTDHWHDEIEFIYVIEGSMKYAIEGEILVLKAGECAMVNSRKLHVTLSNNGAACKLHCVILHPMLLSTSGYVDKKYIEPIIKNPSLPYVLLDQTEDWMKDIVRDLEAIYEVAQDEYSEMTIIRLFFHIWEILYKNVPITITKETRTNHHLVILKDMISFIHAHYKEKISLEDICNSGGVGKTMGTSIFNMYVNKTPGEFLKDYRVQKSIQLLQETDLTITEICFETGFSSSSYFAETFKKAMNLSPLEFRKQTSELTPVIHFPT